MRIFVIAPEFPPLVGGMAIHAWKTTEYLWGRGHDVTVVTRAEHESPLYDRLSVVPCLGTRFSVDLMRICQCLRAGSYDVVLLMNAGYAPLSRVTSLPVVCRVVGNDVYRSWIGPSLPLRFAWWCLPIRGPFAPGRAIRTIDQRLRNAIVTAGLRSCRYVLPNSGYTRDALEQYGIKGSQVEVIVGGVDTEEFKPRSQDSARSSLGLDTRGPILITVANLVPIKGIDVCLRAVDRLRREHADLLYLIIGAGPEETNLRILVKELKMQRYVLFLGKKNSQEVASYLNASDVYVQSSRLETMGRAACEASASGLPVVGTFSGGLPEVVQDGINGLLVPPDDDRALAKTIGRLLQSDELRRRLGQGGRSLADGYLSWNRVAKQTERLLCKAVNGKAPEWVSMPEPHKDV